MPSKDLYIKCDSCGEKIAINKDKVYKKDGYCGCYCSLECYLDAYGNDIIVKTMTLETALDCRCDIFEETPKVTKVIETGGERKLSKKEVEDLEEHCNA